MISAFAVAYATEGTHLIVPSEAVPIGIEDSIVIDMPEGFTLGDLITISWAVYMECGYPLHVDIILGTDIDGDPNNIDSLTAEIAENDNPDNREWLGDLENGYTYDAWLKTFEYSDGNGDPVVDDNTILWVTRHGSGCDNAPYGTLAELKAGQVTNNDPTITIDSNVVVLRLEFEIDNWLGAAEAYVRDIQVNGQSGTVSMTVLVEEAPVISISVSPTTIGFGSIAQGGVSDIEQVLITSASTVSIDVRASVDEDDKFYTDNLLLGDNHVVDWIYTLTQAGSSVNVGLTLHVPSGATLGLHEGTLVIWAEAS